MASVIEEMVKSLSKRLREKFGEEYKVYTEGVYMGAEKPCFFIECEKAEKIPLLGKRFMLRVSIAVTLVSESDTKRSEAENAAWDMFGAMSYIEAGERISRGRGLNGRCEDGGFVMRGVYDVFMTEDEGQDETAMMETMSVR